MDICDAGIVPAEIENFVDRAKAHKNSSQREVRVLANGQIMLVEKIGTRTVAVSDSFSLKEAEDIAHQLVQFGKPGAMPDALQKLAIAVTVLARPTARAA